MLKPAKGAIGWVDLTVPDAEAIRTFYQAVVGWGIQPIEMEGYSDYCMMPPGAETPAAGICHARGPNADLPAQWLVYITVEDLVASVETCRTHGGKILREPTETGGAKMAVIRDPAGAVCALYQPAESE